MKTYKIDLMKVYEDITKDDDFKDFSYEELEGIIECCIKDNPDLFEDC